MLLSLGWENTIPLDIGPMGSLRGETFDVPLLTALACGTVVTLGGRVQAATITWNMSQFTGPLPAMQRLHIWRSTDTVA